MFSLQAKYYLDTLVPILLLAALTRSVTADELCFGKADMSSKLDFFGSQVTENMLQNEGVLKFEDIASVSERSVDLVVSIIPGTTYATPNGVLRNGKVGSGKLGQLNLFTVEGDLDSGEGNFRFCFQDHETGLPATVDSFRWSVFDIDERNQASNGIKEKMTMDLNQVEDYILYPSAEDSEIKTSCEDSGLPPPCSQGERVVFNSSTKGIGQDNPSDPSSLTETQKKRTIVFSFKDTSCWDFTYDHYCRIEAEEGRKCKWYGGGNFMFAGDADDVIEDGECIVSSPAIRGECEDNPDSFEYKGKITSCLQIAALGPQKRSRKCLEGRRLVDECPEVCQEKCETSSPTGSPTVKLGGGCEDVLGSFEFKGKITSCQEIAALGPQKQKRKCGDGRVIAEKCPTVCKETCVS